MAYTLDFEISLGSTKTGLTLAGQLVDSSGVAVGAEISTGFTEIGTGCYILTASIPDGHRGGIKIYVSGVPATILAFASINPEEAEYVDVKVSTRSTLTLANILAGVFEGTSTIQDFFRLASSVLFGKSSGGGTTNPKFRDLADTKDRVDATVTVAGDRTSVTRDAT